MSEEAVSADGLHAASEQAKTWERAVERAERGETVAVLAHGRHVADVVPSGEIERLRETIDVLADNDLLRELHAGLAGVSEIAVMMVVFLLLRGGFRLPLVYDLSAGG